jgi:hypothetical protein
MGFEYRNTFHVVSLLGAELGNFQPKSIIFLDLILIDPLEAVRALVLGLQQLPIGFGGLQTVGFILLAELVRDRRCFLTALLFVFLLGGVNLGIGLIGQCQRADNYDERLRQSYE